MPLPHRCWVLGAECYGVCFLLFDFQLLTFNFPLVERQLAFQPIQLRLVPPFPCSLYQSERLGQRGQSLLDLFDFPIRRDQ